MLIKYTDSYEKIHINIPEFKFLYTFTRNTYYDIPEKPAQYLLKTSRFFLAKDDTIFSTDLLLNKKCKVCFNRFGALGDLIQLLPIARYFKKQNTHLTLYLACHPSYVPTFSREKDAFDKVISKQEYMREDFDKVIYLDGSLESDHSLSNDERLLHRIKLYEKFFNISLQEYDFSLSYTSEELSKVEKLLNASHK
jgi:hypothetical protein